MKTLTSLLALVLLAGCATLDPAANPLIVRTEQVQQVAFDTFDTFVQLDNAHRALFASKFPDAHAAAEWLRAPVRRLDGQIMQRGLSILTDLKNAKLLYKSIPNAANKAALTVELANVEKALAQTQEQLALVKGK